MLSLDKQNELREQYRYKNPAWQPATELYADYVRTNLRPSSQVIDIGCGRGGLVEQLEHPLAQMNGVDPDWRSLREHRLDLSRVAALSDQLPFAAGTFDVAIASWVLEHLANPVGTFQAVRRILRPGGVFIFITPNGRHPLAKLNRALGGLGRVQGQLVQRFYGRAPDDTFPTFYRANSIKNLQWLCQQSGLFLETLTAVADPTYLAFNQTMFRLMGWFEESLPPGRKLHLVGVARRP